MKKNYKLTKKDDYVLNAYKTLMILVCMLCFTSCGKNITSTYIGEGWSKNSVNTVKFRKHAITTFGDYQFVAYYDQNKNLVLGKRKLNSLKWDISKTQYIGHTEDAHNSISIAVDGDGFIHVSWDQHDSKLRYTVSKTPLSLELGEELQMTGVQEEKVTYPEFHNLPNGNLLFFYRSGQSGRGDLVINSYDISSKNWEQLQNKLIDGEGERSAYWQAAVDEQGTVHVSWVWRETWDVETNHDLCYAKSTDGGKTWVKSSGENYTLPITAETAEYAWNIPQNSNLINQTAITADCNGVPYIASYWNQNNVPQYQVVYLKQGTWSKLNTGFRKTAFTLGGGGTKRIPISRPDILVDHSNSIIAILFRDKMRGSKVSLAYSSKNNTLPWRVIDLNDEYVGDWEPNYDLALWQTKKQLHIYVQNVTQIDGEGVADTESSPVKILEIKTLGKLR